MRMGTAERMTRVSAHERRNASSRAAIHVVKYWMSVPLARDEAVRTSSVSLRKVSDWKTK